MVWFGLFGLGGKGGGGGFGYFATGPESEDFLGCERGLTAFGRHLGLYGFFSVAESFFRGGLVDAVE